MVTSQTADSFRDLLLRRRGRSGLIQRELAERIGVNRRSVQEWENGATFPSAERLEALIQVLVEARGLTPVIEPSPFPRFAVRRRLGFAGVGLPAAV